jgi:drug/metabolite transporter (DMT)-like permease
MDWLPLTLLSAFSLATADAATKRYLSHYSAQELVMVRFALTGALLAPALWVTPWPHLPLAFWGWVGALVPLEILAMALYMQAIRTSPLARTLPYLAFTPVFSALTGYLMLGEQVSAQGFGGIALVSAGAYLLNVHRAFDNGGRSPLMPLRAILQERGPRLMLMVAALYSLTSVMGKGAMQYAPPRFFGPFYFALLGVAALLTFGLREPSSVKALWRRPGANLAVGLAMAVMAFTHFIAIQRVEVAYMIAIKRTSLLFGILYGAALFGEERLTQHLAAGALMVAGIFLIAA